MDEAQDRLAELLGREDGPRAPESDAPRVQLAVFAIGDGLFAFPGAQVGEILPPPTVHWVPGCPTALEGVIDVRGEIWSVIRLADLIQVARGTDPHAAARRTARGRPALLLGRTPDMASALRVDSMVDVLECPCADIQPPPDTLPETLGAIVSGVFQYRGRSVLVLDMERLFAGWREGRY
jgi:purine-binding chemotaxis protein CheW